ncbi:MAG: hypothetical protein AVDCRST_MAG42-1430, partial [uncultured Chthoniobacterales bacterium]
WCVYCSAFVKCRERGCTSRAVRCAIFRARRRSTPQAV